MREQLQSILFQALEANIGVKVKTNNRPSLITRLRAEIALDPVFEGISLKPADDPSILLVVKPGAQ